MQVTIETLYSMPLGCAAEAVTADGHSIAFCEDANGRLQFIWDGVAGEPFDTLGELRDKSPAVFPSEDGGHIAYMGVRGEQLFVGRDGIEDPAFDTLSRSVPPTFGGGGRHLAYGAQVAGGDFRLILDGVPTGPKSLAPTTVVFSPDGERLAYVELRGENHQRH